MPIGTLIQKIHCQERPSAMAPPTSGPMAMARPPMPPQAPSARARRSGDTAAERIVSVSGMMIAPPTPWSAREMISVSVVPAMAASAEPSGEQADAEHEDPPAAEAVAERGAGQEQDGEGEGVGIHDPFELGEAGIELGADHRQCGGDDEIVQGRHEQDDRGDGECPADILARRNFRRHDCDPF